MEDEAVAPLGETVDRGLGGGAGIPRRRRVDGHDDEGAKRIDGTYRVGRCADEAQRADIGMDSSIGKQACRAGWVDRLHADLMRVEGPVDRQLVAAAGHGSDRNRGDQDRERASAHHPRNARMTSSLARASFGKPWKTISPRSTPYTRSAPPPPSPTLTS